MYLIDTDIIVFSFKDHKRVQKRFRENRSVPKAISLITYGELLYGACKSDRTHESLARVRRVSELFPIIDVSRAVMETYASIKAGLTRKGEPLDDLDLMIAATALTLNLRLVTNNERHFRRIPGLEIENWTK